MYNLYLENNELRLNNFFNIREGSTPFHLVLDGKEYKLKTVILGDKRQIKKRPHKVTEKHWDNAVNDLFVDTNTLKQQLNHFQDNDLKHLRVNIFVHPELAEFVDTHVEFTRQDLEKLDIELKQIQHNYKTLEDAEIIITDE